MAKIAEQAKSDKVDGCPVFGAISFRVGGKKIGDFMCGTSSGVRDGIFSQSTQCRVNELLRINAKLNEEISILNSRINRQKEAMAGLIELY